MLSEEDELSQLFRSYVTVGASPLLSHLLYDISFISEYRRLCRELLGLKVDSKLGMIALTATVAKKLIKAPQPVQHLWIIDNCFISSTLAVIADCSGDAKTCVVVEDKDSYSNLVSSIAVLMISLLDSDSFQQTESLLFSTFLQGNFFACVFIEDLLCLLARLTNETVVVSWLDWLNSSKPDCASCYHPLLVHVSSLESRLVTFLSPKTRKLRTPCSVSLQRILNLPQQPSEADFKALVNGLEGDLETCDDSHLVNLWRCLEATRPHRFNVNNTPSTQQHDDTGHRHAEKSETAFKDTLWWCRILRASCRATAKRIKHLDNLDIIFDIMMRLSERSDSYIKLSVISAVQSLCKHPMASSSASIHEQQHPVAFTACKILFCYVHDSNPLIKILTLEALANLNKYDLYRLHIENAFSSRPDLISVLRNFSETKIVPYLTNESQDIFSQELTSKEFTHRCSSQKISPQLSEPPSKKIKVSSTEINQLIAKSKLINKEIKKILDVQTLSPNQKSLLSDLIHRYEGLKNSF